jgi:hypothetical protein
LVIASSSTALMIVMSAGLNVGMMSSQLRPAV